MNENPLTRTLNQLAEEGIPEDLDLRTAIHHCLETSKSRPRKGILPMKANFAQPRHLAVWGTIIILFVIAAFLLSPQGQIWAQSALGYFIPADSDIRPVETPIPGTNVPKTIDETDWEFKLSIKEAERRAGFDVLVSANFSDFLVFREAAFNPQQHMVVISYDFVYEHDPSIVGNGIILSEQLITEDHESCEICSLVGASAEIEEVQIGDIRGEYVVGVWQAIDDTGQWGWVSDPYLQRLRWQSNGVAFELLSMINPDDFTKADLIAIAESLR